jgi:hypothetical protein
MSQLSSMNFNLQKMTKRILLGIPVVVGFLISVNFIQKAPVKLNDIQVIGSHNSYKIAIEKGILDYLEKMNPAISQSLQYEHIPLSDQLDLGLRNLELDVSHDPKGGRYANPKGLEIMKSQGLTPMPYDVENKLQEPGLKLFHAQDIDFRSHHLLFKDALSELLTWSNANPDHTPIFILINAKDSPIPGMLAPLPFTASALDSIDMEIRSVLPLNKLITPELVMGESKSLETAILGKGWPDLDKVKGRFLFVLDENEIKTNRYLENHPDLTDAVLFVNLSEGNTNAGFMVINDPIGSFEKIQDLVAKGYMIRTRADSDTKQARTNDYSQFEKAKASGAQVISTDYYYPSQLFESTYQVSFEKGKFERIK